MRDAMHGVRRREIAGGTQVEALDHIIAEMLVEPRPPGRAQRIAWLQHAAQSRAVAAAADQAEMTAALQRHQFENDARLAMALDAEHNAFVGPLHGRYLARPRAICITPSGIPGPFPDSAPGRRPSPRAL